MLKSPSFQGLAIGKENALGPAKTYKMGLP